MVCPQWLSPLHIDQEQQLVRIDDTSAACEVSVSGGGKSYERQLTVNRPSVRMLHIRYYRGLTATPKVDRETLGSLCLAESAAYDHGAYERDGCLDGTRGSVLNKIELWTRDPDRPPIFWLEGLAGTGKTAIAQTIADRMVQDRRLGASFFCSRDYRDRKEPRNIFPTLASQLGLTYPEFGSELVKVVKKSPLVKNQSAFNQMEQLIIGPLRKTGISTVIIIDALDECAEGEPWLPLLTSLRKLIPRIPKGVKFFLTGRPTVAIQAGFRNPVDAPIEMFALHDVEQESVSRDIRLFFENKFSNDAESRKPPPSEWPPEARELDVLCRRAGRLFIYAVATANFLTKHFANPRTRLDILLREPDCTSHEGGVSAKTGSKTTLDSLYMSILQAAFRENNHTELKRWIRFILGLVVLAANPLPPSAIAELLELKEDDVNPVLRSTRPLLVLGPDDGDHPVRPFHRSFPDFITNSERCTDRDFHVEVTTHQANLFTKCISLMEKRLGKVEGEAPNARTPALDYACKSWGEHMMNPQDALSVVLFLKNHFPSWLDVLSDLKATREAARALNKTKKWLKEVCPVSRHYPLQVLTAT